MKNLKIENHSAIFQEERLEKIMALLEKENRLVTNDLPAMFNTTSVTIRKDLIILEKRGLLKRTHGGAIKVNKLYPGLALTEKEKINLDEKLRIAKQASKLISEGDTIILDSGSTTSLLAKEIKHMHRLTVITNAINIANELLQSDIEVILIGGSLLKETSTLVGPIADDSLRKLSAAKLFIGVDGIDFERGLTTPNIQEAKTSRVMMEISSEIILVVDSSKFGRRSLGVISQVKDIDIIITTKKLSDTEQKRFSNDGIDVFMV
ncbi:MAG: DeoR/GlpR family DNA-binding transcription regulator [Bacteroidales bacterium]|nr:DeoR/GlpR family DNA-binding transcription regulator [Bacteroidales bacterium]MDD2611876.1 DeoR/GlpR family DNA-binding transcription regulator [Bacteroidales bacterium]MDD3907582.1 DeoR/GlpR family DNA-binding transcription regulator [Bacteroidales bacterium]MDD4712196.1 DeoR/GlpR family DNA-binding transcription regulator [Bacteroidales bacterium]